ncbi:MAG TPA: hypothetical protein VGL87_00075 [Steroidobacteraceae bacterium]
MTTFLDRLFFAATCVLGWVIFPLFITLGCIALLTYAFLAECFSTADSAASVDGQKPAARRIADRLCGTLQP